MNSRIIEFIKDLNGIDFEDVFSNWRWLVGYPKQIIIVSNLGDLFTLEKDDSIFWLQVEEGSYSKVAENLEAFDKLLLDEDNIDKFLPTIIDRKVRFCK